MTDSNIRQAYLAHSAMTTTRRHNHARERTRQPHQARPKAPTRRAGTTQRETEGGQKFCLKRQVFNPLLKESGEEECLI